MNKWVVRIGLANLIVFVTVYSFLLYRSNIPVAVNDDELRLEHASIPAGSNAFDVLQAAAPHVWWPDKQNWALLNLARDTNWDETLATTLLNSNREALAAWDAAAKLPDLQVPEATNFVVLLPYLAVWKDLAEISAIRENFLLRNGHENEAFDNMLSDIQLSHRMQNSHGVLICYLVSVAVGKIGLGQITHWLGRTHFRADQLTNYLQQLSFDPNDNAVAYGNTIKAEYKCLSGTLETMRDGKNNAAITDSFYSRWWPILPVFNFSQTRALYINGSKLLLKAAPHYYSQAQLPDLQSNRPSLISMFLSGNAAGQMMYYMTMPAVIPSLATKSQVEVQSQATRVILALRAYALVHGRLPSDLSGLVPEFLDKVPTDDFDGQPLRYSAERKIVYSVGKNLKDDGGDDSRGNPSHPPLDQVYHFDF